MTDGGGMTTGGDPHDGLSAFAEMIRDEREYSRPGVAPGVRRARRRRGLLITGMVLAVVLAVAGAYTSWALTAPVSSPVIAAQTPTVPTSPPVALSPPAAGASAISIAGADEYLGADASAARMLSGTDDPQPIASISKLITALVVLDAHPLDGTDDPGPTITFDEADHDLYDAYYVRGATIAAMPTGTVMSEHDALATMLIPSASNYAEAVSTWAYGSQSAFLRAVRSWLSEHGMNDTTIVEPTGIDDRNTSTPTDLITLGKVAAADPVIAEIVATRALTVTGPGAMTNTNDLLGSDGIVGLKTGNLGEGRYNLLYMSVLEVGLPEPLTVIGVVLGEESHGAVNRSVLAVLDSIRAGFHPVALTTANQQIGTLSTPWGSSAALVVTSGASILTWSDTPITAVMDLTTPTTYADGEVVGAITWTAGPNTVTAEVEIDGDIEPPTSWWRLTHPSELGDTLVP
ncbi:MAG: D-alanyl-D-alanine carboxypeptidase [Microbacterium sp.]|uniref:D-alanyl-D-alanine carboxypeptidase family protein n=1 Tax=Microbacterium sp. TaxID=51671 RepID=UPI0039E370A1